MRHRMLAAASFALLVLAPLAACPGAVVIKNGVITIEGVQVPDGCTFLQFQVRIEQGGTVHQSAVDVAQSGPVRLPEDRRFDLAQPIRIIVTVVGTRGTCEPFVTGASWQFEGTAEDRGEGAFAVPFSGFRRG